MGGSDMDVMYYRTQDGLADYGFSFEPQPDGTWRAYVERQPSYGTRSTDAHSTHRLSAGGRKFVCWTTAFRTEAEARAVAQRWADSTQRYIRFGERFG